MRETQQMKTSLSLQSLNLARLKMVHCEFSLYVIFTLPSFRERSWIQFFLDRKFNSLATPINISLKPQVWLWLFLTIPQSGIHISVSFLFFPPENPTFYSAIALGAVPVINQSSELWHMAKLAALTWYITWAVMPSNTTKSSGGSHLMQRLCWVRSSRRKKFRAPFSNIIFF